MATIFIVSLVTESWLWDCRCRFPAFPTRPVVQISAIRRHYCRITTWSSVRKSHQLYLHFVVLLTFSFYCVINVGFSTLNITRTFRLRFQLILREACQASFTTSTVFTIVVNNYMSKGHLFLDDKSSRQRQRLPVFVISSILRRQLRLGNFAKQSCLPLGLHIPINLNPLQDVAQVRSCES